MNTTERPFDAVAFLKALTSVAPETIVLLAQPQVVWSYTTPIAHAEVAPIKAVEVVECTIRRKTLVVLIPNDDPPKSVVDGVPTYESDDFGSVCADALAAMLSSLDLDSVEFAVAQSDPDGQREAIGLLKPPKVYATAIVFEADINDWAAHLPDVPSRSADAP